MPASPPVAALDTDVILLMTSTDPTEARRRECAEQTLRSLRKQNARFVVPAPVIAELSRDENGSEVIRKTIIEGLRRLVVEPLDTDSADVAGAIARVALK